MIDEGALRGGDRLARALADRQGTEDLSAVADRHGEVGACGLDLADVCGVGEAPCISRPARVHPEPSAFLDPHGCFRRAGPLGEDLGHPRKQLLRGVGAADPLGVPSLDSARSRETRFDFARAKTHRRGAWVVGLLPLIPVSLFGGVGLLVAFVALAAWAIGRASPPVVAAWRSAPVTWIGRALLVVACSGALVEVVRDSGEIL